MCFPFSPAGGLGSTLFWYPNILTLPGGQAHSLEKISNENIDTDFSCSIFHDFRPPQTQVMKMIRCARSSLRSFKILISIFFSLTKIYYPFFPLSILMSLRVLHVLHNSTSPSQSCSCDSAGNKSKQGFNSFFFIFSSQPSAPQVLHAWLPLPHAHCSRTFPPSLL